MDGVLPADQVTRDTAARRNRPRSSVPHLSCMGERVLLEVLDLLTRHTRERKELQTRVTRPVSKYSQKLS